MGPRLRLLLLGLWGLLLQAAVHTGGREPQQQQVLSPEHHEVTATPAPPSPPSPPFHVVAVACGNKNAAEAVSLIRSIYQTSTGPARGHRQAHVHVLYDGGEDAAGAVVVKAISSALDAGKLVKERLVVTGHTARLPPWALNPKETDGQVKWKCVLERLNIPAEFPELRGRVLYLDTDVVVHRDLATLFAVPFDEHQWMGAVQETISSKSWYNNMALNKRVPFFGKAGINSGVLLADLDRWRQVKLDMFYCFDGRVYNTARCQWPDQDTFNQHFHDFPHEIKDLDCTFNLRTDLARDCAAAAQSVIVHGSRSLFHGALPGDASKLVQNMYNVGHPLTFDTVTEALRAWIGGSQPAVATEGSSGGGNSSSNTNTSTAIGDGGTHKQDKGNPKRS